MSYYLVQRVSTKTEPFAGDKGFDQFFSLDYMGSSEFEWGAIPDALKRIRAKKVVIQACSVTIEGVTRLVHFVGHKGTLLARASEMEAWSEGTQHRPPFWGKELTRFPENFAGTADDYDKRTDAWWAIKEDVAWTLDPVVAANLETAFNSKPVTR
jgi:hypothetical protein